MRSPTSITRRRFLATTAGVAAASALPACAASISSGGSGGKTTLTVMTNAATGNTEFGTKAQIAAAEKKFGITINLLAYDVTKLTAMLSSGNPPDIVRGMGVLDTPYLVAHDVATNLDPYFAKSTVLRISDLDPINDVWRYDGTRQGRGRLHQRPRHAAQQPAGRRRGDVRGAGAAALPGRAARFRGRLLHQRPQVNPPGGKRLPETGDPANILETEEM
jgi:hypothetical protein